MTPFRFTLSLLLGVIASLAATFTVYGDEGGERGAAGGSYAKEFIAVKMAPQASAPLQLAVHACAGLKNRKLGGSVFVLMESHDQQWLDLLGLKPKNVVGASDFLNACAAEFPACVRYSYADQHEVLPSILTVAAVLGAVPLDVGMNVPCNEVVLDATVELKDRNTPRLATEYVFEKYVEQTTGLAMLNPGYDKNPKTFSDPGLTRDMEPSLVDFVFSQKLFTTFLNNGCRNGHPEKKLLHAIVNSGHWPTPLGVYGYNDSWGVAGYLYEAQTRALDSRNMGAIPTMTYNLSFFSTRRPPIENAGELRQPPLEDVKYDPNKTYAAFVVGDGDNVRFMMTTRKDWFLKRLAYCEKAGSSDAPLTWSISPHLPRIAPDVLEWYYAASRKTGKDYFALPPSGHLYAYPSSLNEKDQDRFALATERDARILGVRSVVHWDWFGTWKDAEERFLPKYAKADGVIRGVVPVNVPYFFPAFKWWPPDRVFTVLSGKDGGRVVVFRPDEWRGADGKGHHLTDKPFCPTPQEMADKLSRYPRGTVTAVYMTSDGGLNLENSFLRLVDLLPPRVQIVSADTAARLAMSANR